MCSLRHGWSDSSCFENDLRLILAFESRVYGTQRLLRCLLSDKVTKQCQILLLTYMLNMDGSDIQLSDVEAEE